jgi:DNA-binding CsgD family transcriptional regulator
MVGPSTCLTPREAEVLALIAQGCHYSDVADLLSLSPHTVDGYLRDIREKLGVSNTVHAVFLVFASSSAQYHDFPS